MIMALLLLQKEQLQGVLNKLSGMYSITRIFFGFCEWAEKYPLRSTTVFWQGPCVLILSFTILILRINQPCKPHINNYVWCLLQRISGWLAKLKVEVHSTMTTNFISKRTIVCGHGWMHFNFLTSANQPEILCSNNYGILLLAKPYF